MISVDLDALAAALAPRLVAAMRPAVGEELRAALVERERDAFLDARGAAALVGRSPAAWKMLRRRHPEIDRISVGEGKSRRWRRTSLTEWISRSSLRAAGADR